MTRHAVGALWALILLLPLAAPLVEAAPTTFTVNVVSARSLGCSPDFWTQPDLRVRVLVNDQIVLLTPEASDQAEPSFGMTATASATLPATIGIEVEEGEPAGFLGSQTTYLPCSVAPGGATRATFTYQGESARGMTVRGDDSKAAEAVVVVGTGAPPAPTVTASATTTSATLRWGADPTGQTTGYRAAGGGAGRVLSADMSGNTATLQGLCDNTAYVFRIIRDTPTWHVTSADTTITTANAPPSPPTVLNASHNGNVSFESKTMHDASRYEVHASSSASFSPTSNTLRRTLAASTFGFSRTDATGVPFQASDAYVRVRIVDTGGLSADSPSFMIGAPAQQETFGMRDDCPAPSQTASAPAQPTTSSPPPESSTPPTTRPTTTTPTDPSPRADPSPNATLVQLRAAFEVRIRSDVNLTLVPLNVTPGSTSILTVVLINHGDVALTADAQETTAVHDDPDIGRGVRVSGYALTLSTSHADLAPASKAEATVAITVPLTATVGDTVTVSQAMRVSDGTTTDAAMSIQVPIHVVRALPAVTVQADADTHLSTAQVALIAGAGAAASVVVLAAVLRRDATKFAIAAALYTRISKDEVLDHPARQAIQARIAAEPGVCYSDIRRDTRMNTGALVHHLRALERSGHVTSRRVGSYRRFYATGSVPTTPTPEVLVVDSLTPMQARVLELLRERPMTQGELGAALGLSQQGTSHHVKALVRGGHVEPVYDGSAWRYHVLTKFEVLR